MKRVKMIYSDGEVEFEDGSKEVFEMDHEGIYYLKENPKGWPLRVYFGEGDEINE